MSKQNTSILIRLSTDLKEKLDSIVEELREQRPEGNYTASSIARAAIIEKIEELEQGLKGNKKIK